MKARLGGFATLAAVGILALALALAAGAAIVSRQMLLEQGRIKAELDERAAAWKEADALLAGLRDDWNADGLSLDSWWAVHASAFPSGSELVSLSGRINLNSISPFLLKDSELASTLLGRSVEDFVSYRTEKGPFTSIDDCKDYFQPAALSSLYCLHSIFCVNTADEIMIERLIAARTGDEAFAASVRSRIRDFRTRRQPIAQSDWDAIAGAERQSLGALFALDPEIDVNTAPPEVLGAILRDPDWTLQAPDAKLQAILGARSSRPWNEEGLRQLLGVDASSPLLGYLGTRTRFIRASLPSEGGSLRLVALVDYSADSPPKIALRVIEERWIKA